MRWCGCPRAAAAGRPDLSSARCAARWLPLVCRRRSCRLAPPHPDGALALPQPEPELDSVPAEQALDRAADSLRRALHVIGGVLRDAAGHAGGEALVERELRVVGAAVEREVEFDAAVLAQRREHGAPARLREAAA